MEPSRGCGKVRAVLMAGALEITNVTFKSASAEDVETGLLGWVSCTLNHTVRLDGMALRRTADARLVLSFPARRDAMGQKHFYVQPLGDTARRDIEFQILRALGLEEPAAR